MSLVGRNGLLWLRALLLGTGLLVGGCNLGSGGSPKQEALTKMRLHELSFAMAMYMQDWDDTLPPGTDAAAMHLPLATYLGPFNISREIPKETEEKFIAPVSGKAYVFNSSLAGKKLTIQRMPDNSYHVADVKVLFYEPTADWRGHERYVVMQDGEVKRVSDNIWSMTKKDNGIP